MDDDDHEAAVLLRKGLLRQVFTISAVLGILAVLFIRKPADVTADS